MKKQETLKEMIRRIIKEEKMVKLSQDAGIRNPIPGKVSIELPEETILRHAKIFFKNKGISNLSKITIKDIRGLGTANYDAFIYFLHSKYN